MGVSGQRHAPAALPPGKTRYPLYRRLGGPQGRSGQVRKISPPPGFDPPTNQSVAIRYTDWAIPAHGGKWYSLLVRRRHSCRVSQPLTPFLLAHHHMGSGFFQGCTSDVYSDTSLMFSRSKNCLFVLESIPFSLWSSSQPYSQDIVNRNTVASTVTRLHARWSGVRILAGTNVYFFSKTV
jgi:hypothetical protein